MVPSGAVTITEWGTLCKMCAAKIVGDDRSSSAVWSAVPQARQYQSATPHEPPQAAHAKSIPDTLSGPKRPGDALTDVVSPFIMLTITEAKAAEAPCIISRSNGAVPNATVLETDRTKKKGTPRAPSRTGALLLRLLLSARAFSKREAQPWPRP